MNNFKISHDDPRLTAYALGELEGDERTSIEAALKTNPAAQAVVAEIRALAGHLEGALENEPIEVPAPKGEKEAEIETDLYPLRRKVVRFPAYLVGSLAAACLAVIIGVNYLNTPDGPAESGQQPMAVAKAEADETKATGAVPLSTTTGSAAPVVAEQVENKLQDAPKVAESSGEPDGSLEKKNGTMVASINAITPPAAPSMSLPAKAVVPDLNVATRAHQPDNDFLPVRGNPLSTFSVEVDTASYANVRRFLQSAERPPREEVRIEELVNYFPYQYTAPKDDAPFSAALEVASAPWNPDHRLVRIGLKGREAPEKEKQAAGDTLVTIAKDVKLQVEFNPAVAQSYRLIGYENRILKNDDVNSDKIDAGEIGAGHTVTALYEVVPVGAPSPHNIHAVDPLKYQPSQPAVVSLDPNEPRIRELLTVKIRYKEPASDQSRKIEFPVVDAGGAFDAASNDFKFAAAVAGFGMVLRNSPHKGAATLDQVAEWAKEGQGTDTEGRRGEFIELVKKAKSMSAE